METHYVYTDITIRNGMIRGAFVIDGQDPQIRVLPFGLKSHEAEVLLILTVASELPPRDFYVICNDTTTLKFMTTAKNSPVSEKVDRLRCLLTNRNIMLNFMAGDCRRPPQYDVCHEAARKATERKSRFYARAVRSIPLIGKGDIPCEFPECQAAATVEFSCGMKRNLCPDHLPMNIQNRARPSGKFAIG